MAIEKSAIIILGASGDLALRKLIPALRRLLETGGIDSSSVIVGSGRTPFTDEEFRKRFDAGGEFASMLHYHVGLDNIRGYIDSLGTFTRYIFFMALPPKVYASTAEALYNEGFKDRTRLVIEKPFGYDYDSAKELNTALHRYFREEQIYRIDHYLAKEAVQNILVFRFANSLFYPIWNSGYVESIQINAFEEIGVEDRGAYFDGAGIIRDMVQNHLLQMVALITMEAPVSLEAEDIRSQKMNILKSIEVADCRRFQYRGYRDEKGVAPDSTTETYAELKLFINTFRWTGMPIYIRTGKALGRKGTEIGIKLRSLPRLLFNKRGTIKPNVIVFKIQPSEGIVVDLASKTPGSDFGITGTMMQFCYHDAFDMEIPEAYQKLLLDALKGDRTLFVGAEETELAWHKFAPILNQETSEKPGIYEPGNPPDGKIGADWIEFDRYGIECQ